MIGQPPKSTPKTHNVAFGSGLQSSLWAMIASEGPTGPPGEIANMPLQIQIPDEQVDAIARRAIELMPSTSQQRLLSVPATATYINRSEDAVRAKIRKGQLPTVRIDGRVFVDKDDLDRMIEAGKE